MERVLDTVSDRARSIFTFCRKWLFGSFFSRHQADLLGMPGLGLTMAARSSRKLRELLKSRPQWKAPELQRDECRFQASLRFDIASWTCNVGHLMEHFTNNSPNDLKFRDLFPEGPFGVQSVQNTNPRFQNLWVVLGTTIPTMHLAKSLKILLKRVSWVLFDWDDAGGALIIGFF